ncbi:MAG: hypothetical protein CMJ46_15095 [Planctomyces sp.]|nr:hypothetical protein [Planctomyces sp.]
MKVNSLMRSLGLLILGGTIFLSGAITGGSRADAGGLRYIYPRLFGPVVPSYGYNYNYGYGYGYRGFGQRGLFHNHGLGIYTPPNVNRFVFRTPPIAIAPYTYYYGNGGWPFSYGYYNNYGFYPTYGYGYYGNPYFTHNSYYGGNNWSWSNNGFNGYYGNVPSQTYKTPAAIVLENKRLKEEVARNREDWIEKVPGMPDRVIIAVRPSSRKDNLESVRMQRLGDLAIRGGEYGRAYQYYERAVKRSSDQAEFRMSLATVLAATGRFQPAIEQIEKATQLHPDMQELPRTFADIFGDEGDSEREKLMTKVAEWTSEDQNDPERLLLMGSLMVMNGRPQDARPFLEVAASVSENEQPSLAFLEPIRKMAGESGAPEELASVPEPRLTDPILPPPGYGVLDISEEEATLLKPPPIPDEQARPEQQPTPEQEAVPVDPPQGDELPGLRPGPTFPNSP